MLAIRSGISGFVALMCAALVACAPAAPPTPTAPPPRPTEAPKPAAQPTAAPAAKPTEAPAAKPAEAKPTAKAEAKPAAKPAALARVRYGLPTAPPAITTVGAYFALENGFFRDEGLEVEIIAYPGATTATRALLSRDVEIVMTGGDTAYLSHANGAPIKIISSPVDKGTDSVVAARSVGSLKDLGGKRWAIATPNDTSHVAAKILAERNGVDPNSIDFLPVGGPADRARALIAGRVDASSMTILILQPVLEAIDKGDVKVLTTLAKEFPDLPLAYNITRDDLVKEQGDLLTRFLKAELKGYRWATQNPEQAADIAMKYIREVERSLMVRGMKGLVELGVYGLDGGVSREGIERTQKTLVERGALRSAIKVEDVFDPRFVEAAVKELGPARK